MHKHTFICCCFFFLLKRFTEAFKYLNSEVRFMDDTIRVQELMWQDVFSILIMTSHNTVSLCSPEWRNLCEYIHNLSLTSSKNYSNNIGITIGKTLEFLNSDRTANQAHIWIQIFECLALHTHLKQEIKCVEG